MKIDHNLPSFSLFSAVVDGNVSGFLALDMGRDSTSSAKKLVSIVLPFLISMEISMMSELGGCEIIVRFNWYWVPTY